jgi:hypothetical protein
MVIDALEPWEPSAAELEAMRSQAAAFPYLPLVSIAIPLAPVDELWVKATLNSALRQCYPRIEVCVAAERAASGLEEQALAMVADADPRLKVATGPTGRAHGPRARPPSRSRAVSS